MRSFQLSPRTMATMAMPVLGASAVSARVSVRAKRSFVGARTQGVTQKAHRPAAATRVAASAHSVDRVDDLHLGQVRRVFHIVAIDIDAIVNPFSRVLAGSAASLGRIRAG